MPSDFRFRDRVLLPALLAIPCAFVLSLPVLPTQDGPMHLYLASVYSSLLGGSGTFRAYFSIRHYLSPYALYYYWLLALGRATSFPLAEKLAACLVFLVTGFGFRFLTRTLHDERGTAALFVPALLLNWPLFMGFITFSLSLGMGLWAMSFWVLASRPSPGLWRWRVAYLCTLALMSLTHPVPVLILCAFALVDTAWSALLSRSQAAAFQGGEIPAGQPRPGSIATHEVRARLLLALAGCLALGYIATFADRRIAAPLSVTTQRSVILRKLASLSFLSPFAGAHPATLLHRAGLLLLAAVCFALAGGAFFAQWRKRHYRAADALFLCACLLAIAIPFLPPDLNGQHFFTARLLLVLWLALLGAASAASGWWTNKAGSESPGPSIAGSSRPAARHTLLRSYQPWLLPALAVLATLGTDALARERIAPAAYRIAALAQMPAGPVAGQAGLLLDEPTEPDAAGLSFDPYRWAAAHYFRQTGTVLLDVPWMDSEINPLNARTGALTTDWTQAILDSPANTEMLLATSPQAAAHILPYTAFVLLAANTAGRGGEHPEIWATNLVESLDREAEPGRRWSCTAGSLYILCTAPGSRPLPQASFRP